VGGLRRKAPQLSVPVCLLQRGRAEGTASYLFFESHCPLQHSVCADNGCVFRIQFPSSTGRVLKKGLRRREREAGVGLGRKAPQPHPCQLSLCSSGIAEGTAPRLFFYTLFTGQSVTGYQVGCESSPSGTPRAPGLRRAWAGEPSWDGIESNCARNGRGTLGPEARIRAQRSLESTVLTW